MRFVLSLVASCLALGALAAPATAQPLTVSWHTAPTWGRYYPAHVEAAWVVSADGSFERTLHVWGYRRRSHLAEWMSEHPWSESLDAITSATLRTDSEQTATWDLIDTDGALVPDGEYRVRFELADTNSTSSNYRGEFAFTKGPDGFDSTQSDSTFLDVHVVYDPSAVVPPDAGMPASPDAGVGPVPGSAGARPVPIGRGRGSPAPSCSVARLGEGAPGAVAPWLALGAVALLLWRRRRS